MTTATVETVLKLVQKRSDLEQNNPHVALVLDIGSGKLWDVSKEARQIDHIEALFLERSELSDGNGEVHVRITLLGGATFVEPYVSNVRNPPPGKTKIDCISPTPTLKKTTLILALEEPQEAKTLDYPNLFFHTSEKIVDPSVSVTRGVGG